MPALGVGGGAPLRPLERRCAVTGRPAKYLDPLTGEPYATLEAFKALRARHALHSSSAAAAAAASSAMH